MKTKWFSIFLTFLLCSTLFLPISIAQDYTTWGLPEGATKRLGKGAIREIAYSPDGTRLAVASAIGIWIYDAQTGEELNLFTGHTEGGVVSVSFSPDGEMLASGSFDQTVRLWDVKTGETIRTLTGHIGIVESVSFSPNGQTLASGGGFRDNTVRLWDVSTGELLHTLTGHMEGVDSVSFSPDGQTLASGSEDETVRLWDVATGAIVHTLTGHTDRVNSVSFSPDGQTLASGSEDETIRLWDVATGAIVHTLTGHTWYVYSVSFSPDGETLTSGSWDETIRLWDVRTGETLRTLTGHTAFIESVSFSPDGQTLASASGDKTVRLWDVSTGDLVHTFTGHTSYVDHVNSVSFSPDGSTLASGSVHGVLLWALPPASTPEPERLTEDVNGDGTVNIQDLVAVAAAIGETGETPTDVNGDGQVNIQDLVAVAAAFGEMAAGAPAAHAPALENLTATEVARWLQAAQQANLTDPAFQRGILVLEQLLAALMPKETMLLPNYPNPFNPETWIPYQLAEPAEVTLRIYAVDGSLVRVLSLGHKAVGIYQTRSRAAYWDGKNELGEPVASGVYFYTLTAGDFTATRKMLIRK